MKACDCSDFLDYCLGIGYQPEPGGYIFILPEFWKCQKNDVHCVLIESLLFSRFMKSRNSTMGSANIPPNQ